MAGCRLAHLCFSERKSRDGGEGVNPTFLAMDELELVEPVQRDVGQLLFRSGLPRRPAPVAAILLYGSAQKCCDRLVRGRGRFGIVMQALSEVFGNQQRCMSFGSFCWHGDIRQLA
ncbi:MAG: hypothetical protein A3E51_22545 [Burkholderiales bacterium RIFCSPHIGHO2_12_FULL_67_38]|nr:MAG: hypothetical protein A3I64_14030 [Burkholderiales bacterium RIFCSPLOWO2_02_FULL_67_64]OGB43946.1 MAG: hypothetical protein A3E51_22545 [Burkholderiales bacterium RIFCSPHIGHO2_12_FULL_67_38]OGB94635.1 MAG: hypothetical protein A3G82_12410 [Burkholderiales bacterium RIFCSPLOWO2_12_FULL_67_210]